MNKMTEGQLRALVARILADTNPSNCDGDRAQVMIKSDPEFPARFEEFVNTYELRIKILPSILQLVSTIVVDATTGKFVAKDKFQLKDQGGICFYIGPNFNSWFLDGEGKIEEPIGKQTLRYLRLLKAATDMPQKPGKSAIIPELGGEAKAETTLSELFSLMEKQANGEDGVLLNNGRANIFYIKDQNGVLRAVVVYWLGAGWRIYADSIGYPFDWDALNQVFSRNYVLESLGTSAPAQA